MKVACSLKTKRQSREQIEAWNGCILNTDIIVSRFSEYFNKGNKHYYVKLVNMDSMREKWMYTRLLKSNMLISEMIFPCSSGSYNFLILCE